MSGKGKGGADTGTVGARPPTRLVDAGVLRVAYLEYGEPGGTPVVLLHGFPYDVAAYDQVAPRLAAAGCRVIVPWLRGYGDTRFRSALTPRSGQQGVLAHDLVALLDALGMPSAVLAGYDWGGRAACIVAALWPDRVIGLVSVNGYNIQHIGSALEPASPEQEHRLWYQYYFHGARGRAGLAKNRADLCRLLWRLWSPTWIFDEATYLRSAVAFDNPDFVDIVIHSYRHRFGLEGGDPTVEFIETLLAARPVVSAPTIVFDGVDDGVTAPGGAAAHQRFFSGPYQRRVLPAVGHNLPQEAPAEFAQGVLDVCRLADAWRSAQNDV